MYKVYKKNSATVQTIAYEDSDNSPIAIPQNLKDKKCRSVLKNSYFCNPDIKERQRQ